MKQIDLSLESAHPGDLKGSYSCLCASEPEPEKLSLPNVSLIPVTPLKVASSVRDEKSASLLPANKESALQTKSDRIIKRQNSPYLYIASGDFAIVWPNVIVFTIASILYLVAIYSVTTTKDHTLHKTWMFSKLFIANDHNYISIVRSHIIVLSIDHSLCVLFSSLVQLISLELFRAWASLLGHIDCGLIDLTRLSYP